MGKAAYKKYMKPTKTKNPKTRGNYSTGLKKCFDTCTCIQCRKKPVPPKEG